VVLVCPAGPVDDASIDAALRRCELFGFEGVLAPGARARLGYLAGPDTSRAADLQRAIEDPAVDAIWALRGGYGSMRILERIDAAPLRVHPKVFIGFSDNTAIHRFLGATGLITFHGPHTGNAFPPFTEQCFRRTLFDAEPAGVLPALDAGVDEPLSTLVGGRCEGRLLGGNLALLAALCGTAWAPVTHDGILVLEEVSDAAYRIDRTLTQLRLSRCLEGLRGIVLGRFTDRPEKPGDRPFRDILLDLVEPLGVPVVTGAPIGHVDHQWTLPLGARARLDGDSATLEVLEPAVA
jgi:muramoyltetrapeptide carboxypeptidase